MIDAFSRWVELFPTKTTGAAFRIELFSELSKLSQVEHFFTTAYSKEENGLVERANQEVMRHLRVMLLTHACTTSGLTNGYPWYSVS